MQRIEKICNKLPCRKKIITELFGLIGDARDIYPNAIYLYGLTGSGKSAIMSEILANSGAEYVIVDCVECYMSRILFDNITNGFCKQEIEKCKNVPVCDSFYSFLEVLKKYLDYEKSYIICLENAEKLRDMDSNILPALLKLQELTCGLNICCVMMSELPFEKYYTKTGLTSVITILCPQYNKDEIIEILCLNFDDLKKYIKSKLIASDDEKREAKLKILKDLQIDFYTNFLNVFLSVLYRVCRELPELRMLSRNCFKVYCEPVLKGEIDPNDVQKLWRHISPTLKRAMSLVYTRTDDFDIVEESKAENVLEADDNDKRLAQSLELPFYAKYLLIAAFLASYNSPKDDKRLFVKISSKAKKRMQTVNANTKVEDKMSTSLGPKTFTIDRLLAIFYAILDEKVGLTCNLLSQISSLVHLKFLTFVSGESNLTEGTARLQCTVGLEFIINIGKVVGFNVRKYLCDFM